MNANWNQINQKLMVEWECTLDCNFKCFYCTNGRNDCLEKPIPCITDEKILEDFIIKLKRRFPNVELFLFGGEPFLHPKIDFIINTLNKHNQKFVIQTNFSLFERIYKFKDLDFIMQVSVHGTQIDNFKKYLRNLVKLKDKIRRVDIMYSEPEDEIKYDKINQFFKGKAFLTPIAPFRDKNPDKSIKALTEFNKLKKLYPNKCESGKRSIIWQRMFTEPNTKYTTKGIPCIFKGYYYLFDPQLNEYNCSHRINCEVCPNDHCFLQGF